MSLPVIRALRSLFLPLLIISCALSGCSEDNIKVELIGQIDRSFPAGMTVCLDISGNGKCDADEPSARTNADGTYSVTIPAESLGQFPLVVEPIQKAKPPVIALSAPAGKHKFVSPVSTAVQSRVYLGNSLAEAEADVRSRYSLPEDVDLYTDYQGSSLEPEPVHALLEAVASDYGFDVAGNMETAEVAADAQRIGGRRVSGARAASSTNNGLVEEVADSSPSAAAVSAVDSGSVTPRSAAVAATAASGDVGVVQSQEAEASTVLASAEDKISFVAAAASEAASCTPKIVHKRDVNIPSFIEAGTAVTFRWEVYNDSSCDAVDLRLAFRSANPASSTADFGGDNNPSFSLKSGDPGEAGIVEATIPVAPMEVDTYFEIKFDILKSDGTVLDPLIKGPLGAEFTVTAPPVKPTTLLSPNNNASIDTTSPTLDWKSVSGATVYSVVLSDNSSFSGLSNDGRSCSNNTCQTDTTNSTSYPVGTDLTVEFGKTYYWKVRDNASGQWSDYFKFTVSEGEPPIPSDCTARFEFVQDGDQPDEVAPGTDVDLTWEIKNVSDCDAVGYHLGFSSADPDGKNADYGGMDHQSFTIKAGDSDFVQANIRNTPEEEGEYRVEFDIYTHEDELLPSSSGGLTLFSEFTVTGEVPPVTPPPTECTASFVFVEDGYQPDPLEPGQAVDFTWKIKNTSDCDAEDYHLGFYAADPSSPTANYGGIDHQTFSLAAGASGFVTANVKAVPMEGNTYKVEFDIYTDKGEALPVPAGWERLYTQFTVDPCAKISEPKLENVRLIHDVDDKRKVAVLADVPDNGGQEVSLSLKLNDTIYEMSKLQSGGYGAAGWGNLSGDDTFLVTAANECYDTVFNFEDGSLTSYYHGTTRQTSCDEFMGCGGDPVSTYIGNFAQMFIDAAVAGIGNADLLIQRTYNSGAALADAASIYEYTDAGREKITGPAQYFGTGWSSNLDVFLLVLDYAPLYEGIQIRFPDGHTQNFDKNGSSYEPSTPDNFDVLTLEGEEFLLERKHSLEKWRFGADGNLKEIQDRNGNTLTYTYTAGLLTEISEGNRSISFKHDADGHITEVTLPEGIVLAYQYEDDLLVAMTDGEGNRTQYRYNEKKQLAEIVTPLGHSSVRMSYDDRYRVSEQTVGENELYAFAYQGEDAAEATTITDSYGNATVQKHDEEGRQKEVVHPDGSTELFEYDEHNNRTRYVDPAGGEYRYTYDTRGNRLTLDGPLGLHKQWDYNLRNLVNSTTEKIDATRERSFTFDYDNQGNLKQFCLPLGDCGSISYDAHGLPVQMTDLRGNTTVNAYDAEGDLISVTDPEGAATGFSHDDLGRIVGKTKPLGNSYSYTYDNNSNLIAVDGPLGFHIGYEYDANNNLTTSLDPNGGAIKYDWTASDSIAAVTNQLGFTSSFAYGLMNERTGRTDAEGRAWSYLYDNMLRVTDVNGPLGLHQGFNYNALGLITDATDPENRVKHVEYDALGRPLTVTRNYLPGAGEDADTNVTTAFTYDLLGNRLAVTDPEGYAFKAEYDLQNRLSKKQDAEGYEWEYSYDPMGNLLSVLNPRGYATSYAYTPTNRLQSVTNPEAHARTLAYNGNGKLTQVTDPMGIVTSFAYNELDRRSEVIRNYQPAVTPDQETNVSSKFEYDAAGNLRFVTNPLKHQAEIRYDAAHRRSEMIDFEGGSTVFAYDKVNNLLQVTDAEGNATTYSVDELDRLIAVTNAENETTGYTYDLVGNRTKLIEADDTVTLYEFDGVYRLNRVHENYRPDQDPGNDVNAVTAYSYDRRGLLTSIINANNAETLFEHNGVGKLIKEIDPLNKVWEYGYDGNRNRISRRDAKGELTEYGFYPDDMLEQISYADASTVAYQYDANNNRIGMSDKLGQTSWAFDSLNRVKEQNDPFARVLGYQYDAASNRTGVTYPDGNQVGYAYSPNNWLQRMTDPAGQAIEYSRDLVGNLTQIVNPNQTETTVAYDKVYRTLERINRQVTNGGKTNSGFKYTYNEVGHITEAIKEYGWRKPSVVTEAYEYDGLHRLAYMSMSPIKNNGGTVETAYSYDPVGNRLSWESNDDLQTNTPFDGFYRSYEYNAANQMLAMENAADKKNDDFAYEYRFDANGNRINRQLIDRNGPQHGVDYSYDPENRLSLVQDYMIVGGTKKEEDHRIDRA
ncbi:hypothetical protein VU12_12350, partial [Desulfobulbus sp. US4]|nr:hypothetical protein [Desulfobulbus sp. US4]